MATHIVNNTVEDVVDELSTGTTYYYGNIMFEPLKNKLKDGVSNEIVKEALESGINTLQFSIMNAVMLTVQEMVMSKILLCGTVLFSYVKAGKIIKSIEKIKNKTGKKIGRVGGKILKSVTNVITGSQEERLGLAKMANDNVNNFTQILSQERQNQILMKTARTKHFDSMLNQTQKNNFSKIDQDINLFRTKTEKGLWTVSQEDKKLYERATGTSFAKTKEVWNKNFVDKWNSVAEVAKDSEGQIISQTQAFLDYITTVGITRAK